MIGSGIAAIAASKANIQEIAHLLSVQTIGHDKLNQLRHVRYFKNLDGIKKHMMLHAQLIRPKFKAVIDTLESGLGGLGIGSWYNPKGGYFVSFDSLDGCAKRIVKLAADAGVKMTGAGATYPYGKDPRDSNIRIAPTYPSAEELQAAMNVFVTCVKLASVEKLLEK